MKNLIAVLTLMLAFSISANAQDTGKVYPEAATKDAALLTEYLSLTPTQQNDFTRLFAKKHKVLNDADATEERKSEIAKDVDSKIRATLTSEQMKKLEDNPELYTRLKSTAKAK